MRQPEDVPVQEVVLVTPPKGERRHGAVVVSTRREDIERRLARARAELDSVAQEAAEAARPHEEAVAVAEAELAGYFAEREVLDADVEAARGRLEEVRAELARAQRRLDVATQDLTRLEDQAAEMDRSNAVAIAGLDALRESLARVAARRAPDVEKARARVRRLEYLLGDGVK